jgi:hypothetical protein
MVLLLKILPDPAPGLVTRSTQTFLRFYLSIRTFKEHANFSMYFCQNAYRRLRLVISEKIAGDPDGISGRETLLQEIAF